MRRTVFIAEGLSVSYQPKLRLLTGIGLAKGKASLAAAAGATAQPASLRFGPGERARPVEYRTATESEPLVITPPHVAVLCPGAGVTAWTTSLLHLVTEDFADAGACWSAFRPRSAEARQASRTSLSWQSMSAGSKFRPSRPAASSQPAWPDSSWRAPPTRSPRTGGRNSP